jgi:PAS domain S-box-containing protein
MLIGESTEGAGARPQQDVDSVLLKAIVATAVDAIMVIDQAGHICMANPATERLFGYKIGHLLGKNVAMLMPEPYRGEHDSYLRNYCRTGEPKIIGVGREVQGLRRDGSVFPMYLAVAEVQHGPRRYFAGIVHDLSVQKATENALRESEQHLRDVTEAASDWTWEMDERFRLTFVSSRFYDLTGVSPQTVVGKTRWELAGEDPRSHFWALHRADLKQHLPFREFVYRPRLGDDPERELYFKVNGKPVFDLDGHFLGYRGTGTDVTERVLAKRALRESRRSLETLMSNVPGMVYRCRNDPDWTMDFVSRGVNRLTGYRPDDLVDSRTVSYGDLIHPDDQHTVWKEVQAALEERRAFELTYRLRTADQEERWVWEHGCGVFAEDGSVVALEGLVLDISERRQTQKALQALAGSTALGNDQDFIAECVRELARTYDAKYAFVGVFADSSRLRMRTLAVWSGERFRDNFAFDLDGTPCHDILSCRTEIVPRHAAQLYPKDGLLIDLGVESCFGTPLVNSSGETIGLISVMDCRPMQPNVWTRPILGIFADRVALELERKQAEERLRESEAYMRLTLENAPIGIASADLDGRLMDTNPAFQRLLGYSGEEMRGKLVSDITHPDDREETRRHFEALVAGEISSYEIEKRYLRKDGDIIQARARAGLVCDTEGRPVRVVGLIEDETERHRAAREIQRMRAYLKNIIDSMPSVLVGVDVEGRVTAWNRQAERSTGISSDQAAGRPFPDLFPELAGQMGNVEEAIRLNRPVRTERLLLKRKDETRYAEIMVYPLLSNGVMGAVIRMDDITARIRIEQMMVQTEKMLSVGGLAAGMAHEISNPLSIVMQSAQNLVRRISADLPANRSKAEELGLDLSTMRRYLEARGGMEFIEGIQEAGARASRIVSDMLAFSRRSASEPTPNRVDEMLETVVRLAASDYDLKKKYDFRQIQIERDFDPDLSEVECDRTQIEQVLLNLVKNAAHAMADANTPAPRRIFLRTRRDGDVACIDVEDNGPGMDEVTRKRAFEPFFTTKQLGVGTGLGLSVSYFIVTEQHHGSITVQSREGQGSRFRIRLPIRHPEVV